MAKAGFAFLTWARLVRRSSSAALTCNWILFPYAPYHRICLISRPVMRRLLFVSILFLSFCCRAQLKPVTLKGILVAESGESFTYKLVFTDSAGQLEGYAYTCLQEEHDSKAAITGTIDRRKRTLSFRET